MIQVVAAVIGVVLTAFVGIKIRGYRNLVTYEITRVRSHLTIADGHIVPFQAGNGLSTTVSSYSITVRNRGWKNLKNVRLHASANLQPFSIEKEASSISVQTISLENVDGSLVLDVEFMPPKEEITLSFSAISDLWLGITAITGGGENYRVESIHFYIGQQQALAFVKGCLLYAAIGAAVGLGIKSFLFNSHPSNTAPAQTPAATSKR